MAYEYEHEHRNMKAGVYSGLATNESVEEIKEVYRKAKAFDKISNLIEENYVDYGENNLEDIEAIVNEYLEDQQNG